MISFITWIYSASIGKYRYKQLKVMKMICRTVGDPYKTNQSEKAIPYFSIQSCS